MTQARTPAGATSEYLVDATQIPTAKTWPTTPSLTNRMRDGVVVYRVRNKADSSADFVWGFVAQDNGRIEGIRLENGATALDGSVGWELQFVNTDNSNANLAYFGFGSGTEAAKATDKDSAVAANELTELTNSLTGRFNKGDFVQVTADRDGTTGVSEIELVVSYESEGR